MYNSLERENVMRPKVWNMINRARNLSTGEKMLLTAIDCSHYYHQRDPNLTELAHIISRSDGNLHSLIKKLKRDGFLQVEKGKFGHNLYTILFPNPNDVDDVVPV